MGLRERFWETVPMAQMTREEWEALCDNCARCCLHKLEDEDTAEVRYTDVVCALLDQETCRCTDYANRRQRVPDCLQLSPDEPEVYRWLPDTCAYRLLATDQPLPEWHPLLTGDPLSVQEAGIAVRDQCVVETYIHPDEISLREAHWISCSAMPEKQST